MTNGVYPVAYRGTARGAAVAVGMGGLRGAPGGLPGFVAGAALTALVIAWMLSRERGYDPVGEVDYGKQVPPYKGTDWASFLLANGWEYVMPGFRRTPPAGKFWLFSIENWHATPLSAQFSAGSAYKDLTIPSGRRDLHEVSMPYDKFGTAVYDSSELWHKDAGVVARGAPGVRARPATLTDVKRLPDVVQQGYNAIGVTGPMSGVDVKAPAPALQRGYVWSPSGVKSIPIKLVRTEVRAPAAVNTMEQKVHVTMYGKIPTIEFIAELFEVLDLVDALYAGLPPTNEYNPNSLKKVNHIAANWREIDWQTVAKVVEDQIEDYTYAIQGQALAGMSRAAGMPIGLGRSFSSVL